MFSDQILSYNNMACILLILASTQELLDHKVIQQVVSKTSSFEEFQKNLLEAVKCHLFSDGIDVKGKIL